MQGHIIFVLLEGAVVVSRSGGTGGFESVATVEFTAEIVISNVTAVAFLADSAAQSAARNATAISMPGVQLDQVTITNVTEAAPARLRRLVGADVVPSIDVSYVVAADQDQLAAYCMDCGTNSSAAFAYMSTSLSTAVSNGNYTMSLQSSSEYYGATVTDYASSSAPVQYTDVEAFVVTATPSAPPTAAGGVSSNSPPFPTAAVVGGASAFVLVALLVAGYFRFARNDVSASLKEGLLTGEQSQGVVTTVGPGGVVTTVGLGSEQTGAKSDEFRASGNIGSEVL